VSELVDCCLFKCWLKEYQLVKLCVEKMFDYCESRNLELKDVKGKAFGTLQPEDLD